MSAPNILEVSHLGKQFGGLAVIDDLTFDVRRGSRTALIGPNGAGKTSVFNLITGVYPVDRGRILLDGTDITHVPSSRRVDHGVARSFQNVRLMAHLNALENVIIGQHSRNRGLFGVLQPVNLTRNNRWKEEARAALHEAGLGEYERDAVGSLPYGVQKRIELVRALMARPRLLLLDEPAAGLNPSETDDLQRHLRKVCEQGDVTLLVVEHDMNFVGALCQHVVVISFGKKIAEGTPKEVRQDPRVQEIYLGTKTAEPADNKEARRAS